MICQGQKKVQYLKSSIITKISGNPDANPAVQEMSKTQTTAATF